MKNLLFLLLVILVFASCEKETASPLDSEPSQSVDFRSKGNKIDVCHYSVEDDSWHLINISSKAWKAHEAHGDVRLDDQDGDGYVPDNECGFTGEKGMGDCDDQDANLNPETKWYLDADEDGYAANTVTQCLSPGAGYTMTEPLGEDCDDSDPDVNPGATEVCDDGIDNNCNGEVDEDCTVIPEICETYEGGVVFYVVETPTDLDGNGTPDQGLVAALEDHPSGMNWVSAMAEYPPLSDGEEADWFLPTKEQLNWMWENLADIDGDDANSGPEDPYNCGGFARAVYWSSTDNGGGDAWYQYFGDGNQTFGNPVTIIHLVRAVRAF